MKKILCILLVSLMLISSMSVVFADSTVIDDGNIADLELNSSSVTYHVVWPTTSRRITSHFGPRGGGFHYGVDVGAVTPGVAGDPIRAMAAGRVMIAGWVGDYGRVVYLNSEVQITYHGITPFSDDGNKTNYDVKPMDTTITVLRQSRYAHLDTISVTSGANVTRNANLGTMGNTGYSTGVHLHFEIRRINSLSDTHPPSSAAFDPLTYYPNITFQSVGIFDKEGNFYDLEMMLELTSSEIEKLGISIDDILELITDDYVKEMITESGINILKKIANELELNR